MSRFAYEISVFKYTTGRYSEQPPEQPTHTSRLSLVGKIDVKIFLMFIVAENTGSVNIVNYFWSIKNSSEVIEKLRLLYFQDSQVSSFDFPTLYTSLPHDLIKAKVLSLANWCFNRESKTYLCTSDKGGLFSNKKYDSYKCWT